MLGKRIIFVIVIFCLSFISLIASAQTYHHHSTKQLTPHITSTATAPSLPTTEYMGYPVTGSDLASSQQFDEKFVHFMQVWHIPGASIAIMKDGKMVFARGYGWADIQLHQPVQPSSLFRMGSISKTITAIAILKLVEEKKINLDDQAFHILNNLESIPPWRLNPEIYQISVRNLLQMSSGWDTDTPGHFDPMFGPWPNSVERELGEDVPASCESTTRVMMGMPMQFKPGTAFSYSNLNYCMLGLIINKVTDTTYGPDGYLAFVRHHILYPLNIYDMRLGFTEPWQRAPGEVHYYNYPSAPADDSTARLPVYLPYAGSQILEKNFSDAGWIASTEDLVKIVDALIHYRILPPYLVHAMIARPSYVTNNKAYFAMAWEVYNKYGQQTWIKHGNFTGSNGMIIRKSDGTAIAVLFNSSPPAGQLFKVFRPQLISLLQACPVDSCHNLL